MDVFSLVFRFFTCSGNNLAMALNALKKLTKEGLSNMVIEYQNKFDHMLSNINTEHTSLRDRFTNMESQLLEEESEQGE